MHVQSLHGGIGSQCMVESIQCMMEGIQCMVEDNQHVLGGQSFEADARPPAPHSHSVTAANNVSAASNLFAVARLIVVNGQE